MLECGSLIENDSVSGWARKNTSYVGSTCWDDCGGGKCATCDKNGKEGYCCRAQSANYNGDCPDQALIALHRGSVAGHECVHRT